MIRIQLTSFDNNVVGLYTKGLQRRTNFLCGGERVKGGGLLKFEDNLHNFLIVI